MAQPPRPERAREEHTSRKVVAVLLVIALLGGALAFGAFSRYSWCQASDTTKTPVTFVVPSGASGEEVMQSLADHHVIRCGGLIGRILLHRDGGSEVVRAGTYKLTTGMTLQTALQVLTKPPTAVPTVNFVV